MKDTERRVLEMYQRALVCRGTQLTDLPANSEGATAADRLGEKVAIIERESAAQTAHDGAAKVGTAQRGVARNFIKEFLTRIALTADTVARRKPGFDEEFPMPYGKNDEQLLAAGRAVQTALAGDKRKDFERYGLTIEYLDSIAPHLAAFADGMSGTSAATGARGAAVAGIDQAFDGAEDDFEDMNAFVLNFYRDQPEKLAAWRIAAHVERTPRRQKIDAPDAPQS